MWGELVNKTVTIPSKKSDGSLKGGKISENSDIFVFLVCNYSRGYIVTNLSFTRRKQVVGPDTSVYYFYLFDIDRFPDCNDG